MNPPLLSLQHLFLLHSNTNVSGERGTRLLDSLRLPGLSLWPQSSTQPRSPSTLTERPRPAGAGHVLVMGRLLVLTFILTLTATLVGAGEKGRGRAAEDAEGGAASSSSSPSTPQRRAASSIRIPRLGWGGWHTQGSVQSTILSEWLLLFPVGFPRGR